MTLNTMNGAVHIFDVPWTHGHFGKESKEKHIGGASWRLGNGFKIKWARICSQPLGKTLARLAGLITKSR